MQEELNSKIDDVQEKLNKFKTEQANQGFLKEIKAKEIVSLLS